MKFPSCPGGLENGAKTVLSFCFTPVVQRPAHAGECNLRPRNIVPRKQRHIEAFRAAAEIFGIETRAGHPLHLRQARSGIDLRAGFPARYRTRLPRALRGARRPAAFRVPPDNPPVMSRSRGAALWRGGTDGCSRRSDDRTDDDLRICVIDMAAIAADITFRCVSIRYTANDARTRRRRNGSLDPCHRARARGKRMRNKIAIRIFALPTTRQTR
jgi:hypothetical protein